MLSRVKYARGCHSHIEYFSIIYLIKVKYTFHHYKLQIFTHPHFFTMCQVLCPTKNIV